MCKIMVASGMKIETEVDSVKFDTFLKTAAAELTQYDSDGFGYVAMGTTGMFGERWLCTDEAFDRPSMKPEDASFYEAFGNAVKFNPARMYNSFGTKPTNWIGVTSILLHARASTNTVSIENTHPFVKDGTAVIHNGVISNANEFKLELSTCDSEAILQSYLSNKIATNPENMDMVGYELQGWYAVAVLTDKYLDIFKEQSSSLVVSRNKELGTLFCTKSEILNKSLVLCGYGATHTHEVNSGHLIRLNPVTGEVIRTMEFDCASLYLNAASPNCRNGWQNENEDYNTTDEAYEDMKGIKGWEAFAAKHRSRK